MEPKIVKLTEQFFKVVKIADEPALTRGGFWRKPKSGIDPEVWEKNITPKEKDGKQTSR